MRRQFLLSATLGLLAPLAAGGARAQDINQLLEGAVRQFGGGNSEKARRRGEEDERRRPNEIGRDEIRRERAYDRRSDRGYDDERRSDRDRRDSRGYSDDRGRSARDRQL